MSSVRRNTQHRLLDNILSFHIFLRFFFPSSKNREGEREVEIEEENSFNSWNDSVVFWIIFLPVCLAKYHYKMQHFIDKLLSIPFILIELYLPYFMYLNWLSESAGGLESTYRTTCYRYRGYVTCNCALSVNSQVHSSYFYFFFSSFTVFYLFRLCFLCLSFFLSFDQHIHIPILAIMCFKCSVCIKKQNGKRNVFFKKKNSLRHTQSQD